MKKESIAHFDLVKNQNRRVIRNLLRQKSPQSVAQLVQQSELTYPTVAGLLKELLQRDEVLMCSEMESCGGRPGVRYMLNRDYQYGCVMYFKDWTLKGIIYNTYGVAVEHINFEVASEAQTQDIVNIVKEIKCKYKNLSVLALGIPGTVLGDEITYLPRFPYLQGRELTKSLSEDLGIKVFIENDMNATVLAEIESYSSFAHIAYIGECLGVGIVVDGHVIKGSRGYAGEFEYLCEDVKNQEEVFEKSILALVCVLDLPYILISGEKCSPKSIAKVIVQLGLKLPKERIPKIELVQDMNFKYEQGLLKKILMDWEAHL